MTPANVRAAAVWINRETEWRANNWTADCPAWSTTGHWGLYCRTNSDETWLTHAELVEFAKKMGWEPE